jgi:hypothetical protein
MGLVCWRLLPLACSVLYILCCAVLCCAELVLSLAWVDTDTDTVRIDRSILIEIENDSMTMIGSLVSIL